MKKLIIIIIYLLTFNNNVFCCEQDSLLANLYQQDRNIMGYLIDKLKLDETIKNKSFIAFIDYSCRTTNGTFVIKNEDDYSIYSYLSFDDSLRYASYPRDTEAISSMFDIVNLPIDTNSCVYDNRYRTGESYWYVYDKDENKSFEHSGRTIYPPKNKYKKIMKKRFSLFMDIIWRDIHKLYE